MGVRALSPLPLLCYMIRVASFTFPLHRICPGTDGLQQTMLSSFNFFLYWTELDRTFLLSAESDRVVFDLLHNLK